MQPYIFPYIGYFQLIHCADTFVFYDDVNFIKQGWINRNRILLGLKAHYFTVPVENISSFKKINETRIDARQYPIWRRKFLSTVRQVYSRAPFYNEALSLIEGVVKEECGSISGLAKESVTAVLKYLSIDKKVVLSSEVYRNDFLKGQQRVLDICMQEKASLYINLPGGRSLYSSQDFKAIGAELRYIQPQSVLYRQFSSEFVPWLSILDVIFFNSISEIKREILPAYLLEE